MQNSAFNIFNSNRILLLKINIVRHFLSMQTQTVLYHRAHQLQYECLWQRPSGVPSALSSPAPECFPRPAPTASRDHWSALNPSQGRLCCRGAGPSPTGSGTAPGPQTSFPDPPSSVREAPPLPRRRSWSGGRERVRGRATSPCWSSGHHRYRLWLA